MNILQRRVDPERARIEVVLRCSFINFPVVHLYDVSVYASLVSVGVVTRHSSWHEHPMVYVLLGSDRNLAFVRLPVELGLALYLLRRIEFRRCM